MKYSLKDSDTGDTISFDWDYDTPPTPEEQQDIFKEAYQAKQPTIIEGEDPNAPKIPLAQKQPTFEDVKLQSGKLLNIESSLEQEKANLLATPDATASAAPPAESPRAQEEFTKAKLEGKEATVTDVAKMIAKNRAREVFNIPGMKTIMKYNMTSGGAGLTEMGEKPTTAFKPMSEEQASKALEDLKAAYTITEQEMKQLENAGTKMEVAMMVGDVITTLPEFMIPGGIASAGVKTLIAKYSPKLLTSAIPVITKISGKAAGDFFAGAIGNVTGMAAAGGATAEEGERLKGVARGAAVGLSYEFGGISKILPAKLAGQALAGYGTAKAEGASDRDAIFSALLIPAMTGAHIGGSKLLRAIDAYKSNPSIELKNAALGEIDAEFAKKAEAEAAKPRTMQQVPEKAAEGITQEGKVPTAFEKTPPKEDVGGAEVGRMDEAHLGLKEDVGDIGQAKDVQDILQRDKRIKEHLATEPLSDKGKKMVARLINQARDGVFKDENGVGREGRAALDDAIDEGLRERPRFGDFSVVSVDIVNLGGGNLALTHEGANKHIAKIGQNVDSVIKKYPSVTFKSGGDELAPVIYGPKEDVVRAMQEADTKIDAYVAEQKLDKIPHPKHGGMVTGFGRITFGIANTADLPQIKADLTAQHRKFFI